jgi:NADPH2 dehydrogenase
MSLLLAPYEIKGLKLRNRVVMSPMHMAVEDGFAADGY